MEKGEEIKNKTQMPKKSINKLLKIVACWKYFEENNNVKEEKHHAVFVESIEQEDEGIFFYFLCVMAIIMMIKGCKLHCLNSWGDNDECPILTMFGKSLIQ